MPKRAKFSVEDEDKIINFVKSHDILYNMKHKKFRDVKTKNRLWAQLAKELNMNAEVVKKKWQTMRDYFVRSREKTKTNRARRSTKRDESLSFLVQTSILNRYSISSLATVVSFDSDTHSERSVSPGYVSPGSVSQTPKTLKRSVSQASVSDTNEVVREFVTHRPKPSEFIMEKPADDNSPQCLGEKEFAWAEKETPVQNNYSCRQPVLKRARLSRMSESDTKENLREYLIQRPKPSNTYIQEKPNDDLQKFFDSMASTVRKFPPVTIARIKLKIAHIVGANEIAWAEKEAAVEKIFLCDEA